MHIPIAPLVFVAASLAALEASATPIRVLAVTSHIEVIPNVARPEVFRVGLAGAGAPRASKAVPMIGGRMRKGCAGGMREKAIDISNTLRQAIGLPAIEGSLDKSSFDGMFGPGDLRAVMPYDGSLIDLHPEEKDVRSVYLPHPHTINHDISDRVKEMLDATIVEEPSFIERIHAALVELGPWEARAVAFVLGCGIGVLLRMVWIFAVLVVRELSPSREETSIEEVRMLAPEADELPEYTDEKTPAYTDAKGAIA